jgi:hypothetical protein
MKTLGVENIVVEYGNPDSIVQHSGDNINISGSGFTNKEHRNQAGYTMCLFIFFLPVHHPPSSSLKTMTASILPHNTRSGSVVANNKIVRWAAASGTESCARRRV